MLQHRTFVEQLRAMHGTPQARMPFGLTVQ